MDRGFPWPPLSVDIVTLGSAHIPHGEAEHHGHLGGH